MKDDSSETLEDLPPSAKLVYYVLKQNGPMTQKEITEESMLSQRTVRYAMNRLEQLDILTKRINIKDARQSIYEISDPERDTASERGSIATTADD